MSVPMLLALAAGETEPAKAFLLTILICISFGSFIKLSSQHEFADQDLKLRDSYFIVAVSWVIASVVGAMPYWLSGAIPNFIDAFFETCSGFTTTGSTILSDIEAMPKSLLFWRSFTQWLGGMGIMVLFVALLPGMGIKARNIASAETPGPTVTKLSSRFSGTAQRLYILYTIITAVLIALLMFGGMNLFDAVNHAMAAMATGGFGTHNGGIESFHSDYISWVLTIFMLIAGTNFTLFFVAMQSGIKAMFKDDELKAYIKIILVAVAAIVVSLLVSGGYTSIWRAVTDASFQVATILTTTGFNTVDFAVWPAFCQMVLVLLMLSGAMSGSTSGGIKVVRVVTIVKMLKLQIKQKIHGVIVDDVKLNGRKIPIEVLTHMMSFCSMYIIVLIGCTLIVSIGSPASLVTNFTATLSCVSNVGPGLAQVGPTGNFAFYSDFGTFVLAIAMIAGRLELTTFFIIFTRYFWNPHRG